MGATSSTAATSARLPIGVNNLVGELGSDVQYERGMGSSRFLKAIKARHKHGPLVVKTFVKPEALVSLRPLVRRIRIEREALADVPNTLTYQKVVETESAGYLIRQWMSTSLYDRISTRPFLTTVEKKWITYQLLSAMKEARKRNVPHGDLKSENVLVTSSLSVYVTDFASSFKQVYLPLNDPSDFNFFFGTSGRRTCYIAPERFYGEDSEIARQKAKARAEATAAAQRAGSSQDHNAEAIAELFKRDGKVTEAMDVFSMGCVIAELWRDGAPIFTLMQLFKYRDGQYDIEPALLEIGDTHIRNMIRRMLSLDPAKRHTFADHLELARDVCFPESFYTFLHRYLTTLQRTLARTAAMAAVAEPRATVRSAGATASSALTPGGKAGATLPPSSTPASDAGTAAAVNETAYLLRAEADERIERMYEEWSVVSRVLDGRQEGWDASLATPSTMVEGAMSPSEREDTPAFEQKSDSLDNVQFRKATSSILPVMLCIPGVDPMALLVAKERVAEDGPALMILSPLLANLRNALRPSTKLHCFDLLLHLSARWLSDEAKLDRVLPYLTTMFEDESIAVRMAAVRTVVQLLSLVEVITPSNASTFSEYVMPNLRLLTRDSSSLVRSVYAACLVELTQVGTRYLQLTSAMRAEGIFAADAEREEADDFLEGEPRPEDEVNYDRQLDILRGFFHEQATALLTDSSPVVKRSLLANVGPLCTFFGSAMTNDVILSHMITYLNDRSWVLRQAFFDAIVEVARVAGARSVEDYILTLMLQALSDPEDFVVLHVMQGLLRMLHSADTGVRLLSQASILDVVGATAGFLCHPNHWLRTSSALVVAASAEYLGATETWGLLYPSIRPLLRSDIKSIEASNLLFAAKNPLSREVLQKAVQWAFRAKNSRFWKPATSEARGNAGLGNGLGREGVGLMVGRRGSAVVRTPMPRSEEDDAHFDSLRSSGLSEDDEVKLVALRDYITKLAKTSNLIGAGVKTHASTSSMINQEDTSLLPPLQIKSTLAVQPLDDVTPLTIFFTLRSQQATALRERSGFGVDTASIPGSSRSATATSTFSGRMARRRIAGSRIVSDISVMTPLDELRRRMNEAGDDALALPPTPTVVSAFGEGTRVTAEDISRPDSPLSILSGGGGAGHTKLGMGKAHAAVASDTTNVTGTMVEGVGRAKNKDRISNVVAGSGRSTPTGTVTPQVLDAVKQSIDGSPANEQSFSSTYEGNDPYIRAHLEAVYMTDLQDRHPGWGPAIEGAPTRRRGGVGVRAATAGARAAGGLGLPSASVSSNRRPEGSLIAYFTEHTAAITAIAVSPDHAFFLSGSEDGTVKVWDTARLEKNVTSRSRGTYASQRGKIVSLIMLAGSHCAAVAATDGSVHVIRVETSVSASSPSSLPKYGKIRLVSNFQLSNPEEYVVCMVQGSRKSGQTTREAAHLSPASGSSGHSVGAQGHGAGGSSLASGSASGSTLILATSKCHIVILDLRTMQVLTNFDNPAHLGAISAMCADAKNIWLLVATIGGVMCLWDMRFLLLVKTWRIDTQARPTRVGRADGVDGATDGAASEEDSDILSVNSVTLHPSKGNGRWVMIACERLNLSFQGGQGTQSATEALIETWDIDTATCVERYETIRQDGPVTASSKQDDARFARGPLSKASGLDECFLGLSSAAEGIERLVRLHEAQLDRQQAQLEHRQAGASAQQISKGNTFTSEVGEDGMSADDEVRSKYRRLKGREVIPPVAPSAFVRAVLVGTEGYASGNLPHAAQVSGGWLDAGKLVAAEASAEGDGGAYNAGGSRVAGFMVTAGLDRKIRFWDLGRVEKSTAFGAATSERNEFHVELPSEAVHAGRDANGGRAMKVQQSRSAAAERYGADAGRESIGHASATSPTSARDPAVDGVSWPMVRYTHRVLPTPATARAATSSLRSPLLTHHTNASTTTMLMKAHKDAITALGIIESPFRCIVAGDYAGTIRVWE